VTLNLIVNSPLRSQIVRRVYLKNDGLPLIGRLEAGLSLAISYLLANYW
jgi:hypothetical protein